MPITAAIAAVSAAKESGSLDALASTGAKILNALFGCTVKPKGTPYQIIDQKLPKFWYQYGRGLDGRIQHRGKTNNLAFDLTTGVLTGTNQASMLSQIDLALPLQQRKEMEAAVRKPCESVHGTVWFYIENRNGTEDRGICELKDGTLIDANALNIEGGTMANPVKVNMTLDQHLGRPSQTSTSHESQRQAGGGGLVLLPVAYFIAKALKVL